MSRLITQDRARILTVLSEGMGINAACRITSASKDTVLKLLADVGQVCAHSSGIARETKTEFDGATALSHGNTDLDHQGRPCFSNIKARAGA
jgi:hypothetical protein